MTSPEPKKGRIGPIKLITGCLLAPFLLLLATVKSFFQVIVSLHPLIKLIIKWIVIPVLLSSFLIYLAKQISAKDEIARLLIPYHNDYFLFQDYYLTVPSLNDNWPSRLVIFVILPLILITGILVLAFSIISTIKKKDVKFPYTGKITLGAILLWGISKAFFIPNIYSNFDIKSESIFRIRTSILGIPTETITIPFHAIDSMSYDIKLSPTRVGLLEYVRIYVHTPSHSKLLIGTEKIGTYSLPYDMKSGYIGPPISERQKDRGEAVVSALYQIIGRTRSKIEP